MKHCKGMPESRHPTRIAGSAAVVLLASSAVEARIDVVPFGFVQYEYTNVEQEISGRYESDMVRLRAGFEATYSQSRQQFYLDAAIGSVTYDFVPDFEQLEHGIRGGLKWALGRRLDGVIEGANVEQQPSVWDRLFIGDAVTSENRILGAVNFQMGNHLRFETEALLRELETPIEGNVGLGLDENTYLGALVWQTDGRFRFGAEYRFTDGEFINAPQLATYEQSTPAGFVRYATPDIDAGFLKVGYTTREQAGDPQPYEEPTGNFWYQRRLTGKTSLNLQARRSIDNYVGPDSGAFALVTSWNIGGSWYSSDRYVLYGDFGSIDTKFLGDGIAGSAVTGRHDTSWTTNLSFEHKTLRWLTSTLYFRYDDVVSNYSRYMFAGYLIGLKFEVRLWDDRRNTIPNMRGPQRTRPASSLTYEAW